MCDVGVMDQPPEGTQEVKESRVDPPGHGNSWVIRAELGDLSYSDLFPAD